LETAALPDDSLTVGERVIGLIALMRLQGLAFALIACIGPSTLRHLISARAGNPTGSITAGTL
jgi:hypothetical protein